jgi:transposase
MGKRLTRQYDMGFKLSAVELVEQQGYSVPAAAESLGVSKSNLYTWRRQYLEGRLAPGHKRAQPTP